MKSITLAQASALTGRSPAVISYYARHGLLGPDAAVGENPFNPTRLRLTPTVCSWLEAYLTPAMQEFVAFLETCPPAWDEQTGAQSSCTNQYLRDAA